MGVFISHDIGDSEKFADMRTLLDERGITTYTTTGKWYGFSLEELEAVENDLTFYDRCVLLHYNDVNEVDGATAIQRVFEEYAFGAFGLHPVWTESSSIAVGDVSLGQAVARPGQRSAKNYP